MEKQMQKNTSFLDMIERYSICVPKIQRDYAQGREDDKTVEIRESFLEEIIESLTSKENKPLVLDFVYGSINSESVFTPLDGQQRLTTLFLLHWFLLPPEKSQLFKDKIGTPRFTYETRISSNDFCKSLVVTSPRIIRDNAAKSVSEKEKGTKKEWTLSESIQNEPWFLWSWRKDPTIKGMLVMLDAIDQKLKALPDKISLWNSLTENRKVVFHILPLEQFNLADELYVKMNARGKELSSFDILKSMFEEQMKKNEVCEQLQKEWRTHIDSKWMDLFWNKKVTAYLDHSACNENTKVEIVNTVETSYLRFLKRMMFFHLFIIDNFEKPEALDRDKFSEGIKSVRRYVRNHDIITIVQQLSKCGFFSEAFYSFVIDTIEQSLYIEDERAKEGSNFITIPFWKIEKREVNNLFEMFIDNEITYLGRVLFFAQIQFFKYYRADSLQKSEELRKELNNWMRIIRNLSYNTSYNNEDEFRNTLKALESLAFSVYVGSDTKSVLYYFSNEGEVLRFDREQVTEEREKSRQILRNKDWEEKIQDAENYAFFQGCIRFLFTDREGVYNWDLFTSRYENARKFFDESGVTSEYTKNARLVCTLISLFKRWNQCWEVRIGNGVKVWGYIIRNNNLLQPLSDLLEMNEIPLSIENFVSQITEFEAGYEEIEKLAHEDMSNNKLIDEAICIMGEGILLNWKHGQFALFCPRANADWKKYIIGNKRNQILFNLREKGLIRSEQNISGKPYFWGWSIYFTYKELPFIWSSDKNIYFDNNKVPIRLKEQTWLFTPENSIQDEEMLVKELEKMIDYVNENKMS